MHRVFADAVGGIEVGGLVRLEGDEAHHAVRVRRAGVGETIEVLDGRGTVARGLVEAAERARGGAALVVRLVEVSRVEPVRPEVEVCGATPKGSRLDDMIDGLSQVGATAWRPLGTGRGVVEVGPGRLDKVARRAAEASKQCGRAWLLRVGAPVELGMVRREPGEELVLADASGEAYAARGGGGGAGLVRLLIGPEGGFSPEEIGAARRRGARVCRFGPHAMRVEVAAVVAAAVVLATRQDGAEGRSPAGPPGPA
ncbi:MAG TPA: RsmE family RNA methyltransferase [Phycisphaerales bacterium]|nr:RsmE family RNA methyltransferase [Phycisphaerales bacterium]